MYNLSIYISGIVGFQTDKEVLQDLEWHPQAGDAQMITKVEGVGTDGAREII